MRFSLVLVILIAVGIAVWPPIGASGAKPSRKSSRDPSSETGQADPIATSDSRTSPSAPPSSEKTETAVFAAGCFWCSEFAFEQLDGVLHVESGYCGGTRNTAHYETVHLGKTRHAEAIRVTYDPEKVSYVDLLNVFFDAHDPTQVNRQGADKGPQYRSAIFYANEDQLTQGKAKIADLQAKRVYRRRIATKLEPLKEFFPAEEYHQDFARRNPLVPYIRAHAIPNAAGVRSRHPELIRKGE